MTHAIDNMASRRRSIGTWTATQRAKAMFFAAAGLSMVLSRPTKQLAAIERQNRILGARSDAT